MDYNSNQINDYESTYFKFYKLFVLHPMAKINVNFTKEDYEENDEYKKLREEIVDKIKLYEKYIENINVMI